MGNAWKMSTALQKSFQRKKPESKDDAEISQDFKIKVLELENTRQRQRLKAIGQQGCPQRGWCFAMLRMLLRKEGVDV